MRPSFQESFFKTEVTPHRFPEVRIQAGWNTAQTFKQAGSALESAKYLMQANLSGFSKGTGKNSVVNYVSRHHAQGTVL